MGHSQSSPIQQLEGHAGRAWSSIQRQVQTVVQPSKYDAELLHLAVPALAAMLLEPLMNVVSAGMC
jgi:Na+-driven multidrug efflux pump